MFDFRNNLFVSGKKTGIRRQKKISFLAIDLICSRGKVIINPCPTLELRLNNLKLFTKRALLSQSLGLFDPLSLLVPVNE